MTINAGTRLGRYEIRSKIGEGGMGEAYLARDAKLDRNVALKVLPAEVAANRDRMERFVREAKAAAALNHPNIAHIYEIDAAGDHHFISAAGPGRLVDDRSLRLSDQYLYQDTHAAILSSLDDSNDYVP
jgi:serine/threonine protein kinase